MLFLKDLNVFHIDGKEIPCITGAAAPDSRVPGAAGSLYMDTGTGSLYKCTASDALREAYTWQIVGDLDSGAVRQAVTDYLAQNPGAGVGISGEAVALLITILENAVFTTNQTANIAALRKALESGSSGGDSGEDSGGETVTDNITVSDGVMTIESVGSEIAVSGGVMTIG